MCSHCGQGNKAKEIAIGDVHEATNWLCDEAERGVTKQRYTGQGEMKPKPL